LAAEKEHEDAALWSVAAHILEEVLAGTGRYLQRLGDRGPDWELEEESMQCCSLTGDTKQGKEASEV
jgi:hypothetical protein